MANTPDLRSQEQITAQIVDSFLARLGKDIDLNKGSVISQLIEAFGRNMFTSTADIIMMIDALSVDRAEGESLQRLARDKNVPILPALSSTGKVTVTDTSFQKISSSVYAGQPAPVAGSLKIYVSDASKMPDAGSIYLGRGTKNIEGPLEYTSKTSEASGAYWSLTLAPTSPTTKFHNIGELVILAQGGNREIAIGTTVQTPQGSAASAVVFTTTSKAVILDGETTVTNIPVKCKQLGSVGNVPKGAIKDVVGLPFEASVTNDFAFSNGREADTDDDIRTRIKLYEQAKAKGTELAIQYATIGAFAKDELKKVKSSSIVRYTDNSTAIVFDDGSGYEPNYQGSTYEVIIDSAVGGEREVQLRQKPLAQARTKSINAGPYPMTEGSYIACVINNVYSEHLFQLSDFKVPSSATVEEIAASINGDVNCNFLCSTAENRTKLVLYPKDRDANNIKVVVPSDSKPNANEVLGFSAAEEVTIRLYINDVPLFQDGLYAKVTTLPKSEWGVIIEGETLSYIVDGTTEVSVTFMDSHFQAVDSNATASSLTDIETWAQVMTNLMPGVTANVVGDKIDLISNKANDDSAAIEITGGTLRNLVFSVDETLYQTGRTPDFTLNKQTGQIAFKNPLSTKDKLTAGSQFTRANVFTSSLPVGAGSDGRFWAVIDGDAKSINNTLKPTTQLTFGKIGTKLTLTATTPGLDPEGFDDVQKGDWLLVWANSTDNSALIANQGFWRVESTQVGEIIVDDGITPRSSLLTSFNSISSRIVIVRSTAPMQKVTYTSGMTLPQLRAHIEDTLIGSEVDIVGSKLRISTKSYDSNGEVFIVAADLGGEALGLTLSTAYKNVTSHYAYITQSAEANVNTFTHGAFGPAISYTEFKDLNYENIGGTADDIITILPKHDLANDTFLPETNEKRRAFVTSFEKQSLTDYRLSLKVPNFLNSEGSVIQEDDRYYLRSAYKFDSRDNTTIVIDGDNVTKAYSLPVSRKLYVSDHSTPTPNDFSAADLESSLDLNDQASFYDFDFSNFKVHRQASQILTDGTYSIKFKSAEFGPVGNSMRVGFVYPSSTAQQELSHSFSVSDAIDTSIVLPVTEDKTATWDSTSSFTVEVLSTSGGKDAVKFTWRAGTEPDFSSTGTAAQEGDILIITDLANFLEANKGITAKITEVNPTSLTIEMPTGKAQTDNMSASSMVNYNGKITITFASAHNIIDGQRVGLWNTSSPNGATFPFNQSYVAKVLNATQIELQTPLSTPGGSIATISRTSNIVTVKTNQDHGLAAGNIINISGLSDNSLNGTVSVFSVSITDPQVFKYIKSGSNTAFTNTGRFDYQSYVDGTTSAVISTVSKSGTTVTATTAANHGFQIGDLVKIQNITIGAWNNATSYAIDDVVSTAGNNYIARAANTNSDPLSNPAIWDITTIDLTGTFIVETTPALNQFTYFYGYSGAATGTGGSATEQVSSASVARSLGAAVTSNMQIGAVGTTVQEVIDYCASNISDKLLAELGSGSALATISESTADTLGLASDYISTTISKIKTVQNSRKASFVTADLILKGSSITVTGLATSSYNNTYTVLDSYIDPLTSEKIAVVQTTVTGALTQTITDVGSVGGTTPMLMLEDGENSIESNNLTTLSGIPMFYVKTPWKSAPTISDEIRLVAKTNDHINRLWNKLIVTGLSNIAKVDQSKYDESLQLTTKLFGGAGSIEMVGGTANTLNLALSSAGKEYNGKFGQIQVPYEIRRGLVNGQWININNTVKNNKSLGLSTNTAITLTGSTAAIASGTGTFQTIRASTHTAATKVKFEKQGDFVAIIAVDGPTFGFSSAGIKEGDWLRIDNEAGLNTSGDSTGLWSSSTTYPLSARIKYNNTYYISLQNGNLNKNPAAFPAYWEVNEVSANNEGIFQVVRVFGDDTVYIQISNPVEEIVELGHVDALTFYSYDSVMPGDKLIISTNAFGVQNTGTYTVADFNIQSSNLTSTVITLDDVVPNPPTGSVGLAGDFGQFNVEAKSFVSLWKRIAAMGPSLNNELIILLDSPELTDRVGENFGSYLSGKSKLEFPESIAVGVDAYNYYKGLIKELNKIIYGDSTDSVNYPGVRAAGTYIDIKQAILKRIKVSFSVRLKTGIPFVEVRERIKAAVAGYVNNLDVGESVSISRMISAANTVVGVIAVAVTYPTYDASNDLITVSPDERAYILDTTSDITVSVIE
jgi:hypothetical protein